MLTIGSFVWGVDDLPRAVEFWTKALDLEPKSPRTKPIAEDDWIILVPKDSAKRAAGVQFALDLNVSGRLKRASPGRHHLDLYADDQKAEVERLVKLGATKPEREYPKGCDYVVLEDPDGNPFCICQK